MTDVPKFPQTEFPGIKERSSGQSLRYAPSTFRGGQQ
jgi:hypothetical protein